ncbi:hypothetical protein [Alkalimarinus alittae]|uniref:Uncharacterized protein n=1 Tax=Alkalimarinus alittae TaxID=2961619 RepID=A0ABY6N5S1_9ALTE|nr:hypothetical protein [Alkalimarinus alittae]UZE97337.1 hypothetical protein NKI27_06185 [Alkalimarinus alittae]
MNWTGIRFFSKKREQTSSIELSETTLSSKTYQALFRQQLKALREGMGEKTFERFYKKPLSHKTLYWVLESPHADLVALSGRSVADVTPRIKHQQSGYTLPSWYSEGSSLFMRLHFENEVYRSNYSYDDTLQPLVDMLGKRRHVKRFGGVLIYLHRHDLEVDSAPAWLSKMASFVGQASLLAKQNLPVYLVLEGVGLSSRVSTPIGLFRDEETVLAEQFGQWFSQAQAELKNRLLRKSLKDVQYVHDVETRKAAFAELNAIEQGVQQLKQVSEQFNHRWHFSGKSITPWVRAVFIAPNSRSVVGMYSVHRLLSNTEQSQPIESSSNQWWQRFSNILHQDRGCGKAEPENNTHQKLIMICMGVAVLFGLAWSQLMWRDYAHAGAMVDRFNEQLMPLLSVDANGPGSVIGFDRVLERLMFIDRFNDDLSEEKRLALWPSAFMRQTADSQQQTLAVISESMLMKEFNTALEHTLFWSTPAGHFPKGILKLNWRLISIS